MREAYSHIINGAHLRYRELGDSSFTISIILVDFIIFEAGQFPHKRSRVKRVDGKTYIEVNKYIADLNNWDMKVGANNVRKYDHAMLFTRHVLYEGCTSNTGIAGISNQDGVCLLGSRNSVIMSRDYSWTVLTATHELGHSLGAVHDGEENATDCKAEDLFIMSAEGKPINLSLPYSRNPWLFSNCSVKAFKKVLKDKDCVTDKGAVYNVDEWTKYMMEQAGDVFTPDVQCHLMRGPKSVYCGVFTKYLTWFYLIVELQCTLSDDKI
ncbi:hypothetical protein CHS0354_007934 [Potamilus streckersoni]|uniref:Peptidase M12B domain-containing protein n=1 Tax=Potamilus streckersoni TaxID=2493646 RepID=A0AAE0VR17_9BIVA|nr:hypothetical protein CHS0354_007934 [Potamilus streckersoni]